MFMKYVLTLTFLIFGSVSSFLPRITQTQNRNGISLDSKKQKSDDKSHQSVFTAGTFIEFDEKKRDHIGKITHLEQKSNGSARYDVTDNDGKHYQIPDKAVHFAITPPNSPGPAEKLFQEFCAAQKSSDDDLLTELDISPEILELAWEDALENDSKDVTPENLIELVHSHTASSIEKYQAWRLLQSDISHVFFKDMKDHGRVSSFKVKARNSVDAAKISFCMDEGHAHSEICLV